MISLLFSTGKVAVEMAKTGEIQAVVIAHPALVTVHDIKGTLSLLNQRIPFLNPFLKLQSFILCSEVKCPIEVLGGELDTLSPPKLVHQFENALEENKRVSLY
jgi:dienelactone hydrolase